MSRRLCRRLREALPYAVIALLAAGLCLLAAKMNESFYRSYAGFYDSMSYMNQMATVMEGVHRQGLLQAVEAASKQSTVFFPWLVSGLLGYVMEPTRTAVVLVQLPGLLLLLFTSFRYFRIRGRDELTSLVFAGSVAVFPGALFHNGGLPDLRMDLYQAYAFGAFVATLLTARRSDRSGDWAISGILLAFACLVRATTPVYAGLLILAVFVLDVPRLGWRKTCGRYGLLAGVSFALAGWFFIRNFGYLKYYYLVWNTDANARLPMAVSAIHLRFFMAHLGFWMLLALGLILAWRLVHGRGGRLDLAALAAPLIPLAYLVFSGAGLNPYVSLVAVPVFVLFALEPLDGSSAFPWPRWWAAALLSACLWSLAGSVRSFHASVPPWMPEAEGVTLAAGSITSDARTRGRSSAMVAFLHLGSMDGTTLLNHLLFKEGFHVSERQGVCKDGLEIRMMDMHVAADAEWKELQGTDDMDKALKLVDRAVQQSDFIVMAQSGSELPAHHRVNRWQPVMQHRLEAYPSIVPIQRGIRVSATETVSIFRVTH